LILLNWLSARRGSQLSVNFSPGKAETPVFPNLKEQKLPDHN
jgi:hypothetical protein